MIHYAVGRAPRPACGAGSAWRSSTITTTRGRTKVNCRSCLRTNAFRTAQGAPIIPQSPQVHTRGGTITILPGPVCTLTARRQVSHG